MAREFTTQFAGAVMGSASTAQAGPVQPRYQLQRLRLFLDPGHMSIVSGTKGTKAQGVRTPGG